MKEILKLDNQLCFQLYTANRLMTRLYKPLLDPYKLTYPQYLALLVLFEEDGIGVKDLGERLHLDSGTLTPLLKRLENRGYVRRARSSEDERRLTVSLTQIGQELEDHLVAVPTALCQQYDLDLDRVISLRETLKQLNEMLL